jgi:hypothetical protein
MSDDTLSFEEARRKRDENPSLVRCARCGKTIVATVTRCPECGVHFQGEAQEFAHPSEVSVESGGTPRWVVLVAVLLIVAVLITVVAM